MKENNTKGQKFESFSAIALTLGWLLWVYVGKDFELEPPLGAALAEKWLGSTTQGNPDVLPREIFFIGYILNALVGFRLGTQKFSKSWQYIVSILGVIGLLTSIEFILTASGVQFRSYSLYLSFIGCHILGMVYYFTESSKSQATKLMKKRLKQDSIPLGDNDFVQFSTELIAYNQKILSSIENLNESSENIATIKKEMKDSCIELNQYLNGIMQFSKLTALNPVDSNPNPFNLQLLAKKMIAAFKNEIELKKIKIEFNVPSEIMVYSDEVIVEQILNNFISNAIKYSPDNSMIKVIAEPDSDGKLNFGVQDQGCGIAAENQDKIFQRFYRVKDGGMPQVKGTGLGLYLCHFFARKINCEIRLKSQLSVGSYFYLQFKKDCVL